MAGVLSNTSAPPSFLLPVFVSAKDGSIGLAWLEGEAIANTVQMLLQVNPWQQQTHNFLNTNDIIIILLYLAQKVQLILKLYKQS